MDRAEAIERFEKQLTAAQAVLDTGFGASPGESNHLYVVRKEMAAIALEALRQPEALARNSHDVARACEWISVSERLPEDVGDVLVRAFWHEKWGVRLGWYSQQNNCWYICTAGGDFSWVNVTHWMELPEPPKEGETQ